VSHACDVIAKPKKADDVTLLPGYVDVGYFAWWRTETIFRG